jgi:hypothetical protein
MEEKQMSETRIGIDPELASQGLTSLTSVMEMLENAKQAYIPYRDNCNEVFGDELGAEVHEAGENLILGLDKVNETTDSIVKWGKDLSDSYVSVKDSCKAMFAKFK